MNLHNEMISANEIIKVFEMKRKFIKNDNLDSANYVLLKELMDFFQIDRIYIGAKSHTKNKCVPIAEYINGKEPNFLGDVTNFDDFAKFMNLETTVEEQKFIDLIDENNYFSGNDFDNISDSLSCAGYVPSPQGHPKECLMFYLKNQEAFSFLFMERYQENTPLFSITEKLALADIYDFLRIRIEKESLIDRVYNEMYMKNIILDSECMPMCMVNANTKNVIHYNEHYKKFVPNIEVGAIYGELFKENKLFKDKDNSNLIPNSETLVHYNYKVNEEDFTTYWIKKVKPFTMADGTETLMIYIKDTADYIRQLEGVDLLTSAYSMKGFSDYFENSIEKDLEQGYILCTLDIAKFRYINDTKGFDVGNKLLKKISLVLNKFTENKEVFCRMNEDKFAILLQREEKHNIKNRINNLFQKLEEMRIQNFSDMPITYACGISDVNPYVDINISIDRSNMARKTAKGSHQNIVAFFDENMERKLNDESTLETRTIKAIEEDEFTVFLQPKFNLNTKEICGAEALVRWITPEGMIFPDQFIPLFEKNGFIITLDFIVYEKVMKYINSCLSDNLPVYPISVNVSRNHIKDKNFINKFMDLIKKYEIPLEHLELEVTESMFVEDRAELKEFIDKIKEQNLKVSIDDFGTAYSSLQTLTDINIDVLKIDKGFLDNIINSNGDEVSRDEILMKNIINLANELDFTGLCEGVETDEQIELLKELGCNFGQGYVFAKPMSTEDYHNKYIISNKF